MPDNQDSVQLLEEIRGLASRQLQATEELLQVQQSVADRQRLGLRMICLLVVPMVLLLFAYIAYVVWWYAAGGSQ